MTQTVSERPASRVEPETGVLVRNIPLRDLLIAFLRISTVGWGGGTGTIWAMNHELAHRRKWITPGQFALDFGLSRVIPGIHLIAVAIMTGYRISGLWGGVVSCIGFMLPASIITLLLTAGFAELTQTFIGDAAVRGAVAVTAGLTLAFAIQQAREITPWREARLAAGMTLWGLGSFAAVAFLHANVALIIVLGGVLGAIFFRPREA